jgi:hypothetical protein
MKKSYFLIFIATSTLLTSCYSTYYTYKGNVHQQAIGQNKNQILRTYGVPDNTTDDGAGGSILVYERYTQTTTTNINSGSYGRSSTVGGAIYGNGGIIGGSQTQAGSISSTNGISQTSTSKTYCYLFLNNKNIVYDFKTNYGAQYDENRCFNKTTTWVNVIVYSIFIPPVIVAAVPLAIIAQKKAKKNGLICK